VIQFDFAKTATEYYHRVGRVGRAGAPGKVTNFVGKTDRELFEKIRDSNINDLLENEATVL
jgi:superfamily II DNA/RNA helicase